MLPATFVKGYDKRRLRNLLLALFALLAVPTAVVTWQAFDQLKWESWYQHRAQAESLAARINADLTDAIAVADSRRFADYAFVSSATPANVFQRSPLAAFPVEHDDTGTNGYFQIAPDGQFSTPIVPPDTLQAGLSADELLARQSTAGYITRILAENTLVTPGAERAERVRDDAVIEEIAVTASRVEADLAEAEDDIPESPAPDALSSAVRTVSNFSIGNTPTCLLYTSDAADDSVYV